MHHPAALQQLSFQARLERIASTANYFALSVPTRISRTLQTRGPVPVSAQINETAPFLVSLAPIGGGRHWLRVKAGVRLAAKIEEGDRVRVQITFIDRAAEIPLPKDLTSALRTADALQDFEMLPRGKLAHTLRWIDQAAKPVTRAKRIQTAVGLARQQKNKSQRVRNQ